MKTPTTWIAPILAVALSASLAGAQNAAHVDFAGGAQGWSINGLDTITPTGGNPDDHVRWDDPIDTFGIAVRTDATADAAFLGDYAAKGDVRLGLDMKVDYIQNFGLTYSRELVVILYDDDTQGPSGAAAVWAPLGVLDGNGMDWTTFSVDVTDATSDTLPAGWGGRGDEDPETFEPILPAGATWASVLAGVDRVEFTTFVPGFFFGFVHFDVSVDNVVIEPLGGAAPNEATVGFDDGAQGWSINGLDTITPTGGNPDEHIRYPNPVDNFGIAVRNETQAEFLGDYTAKGDVTLALDMKVDFIQFFGSPVPRELVVILYDDDVQGPSGPTGVWTSLGLLDGNGMPWTNFSADVVDVTSTELPEGWGGIGDEDPETFEPVLPAGSTWTSVLSGVDRIEFTTFVPGFFFGFANFDVSVDNVSIAPLTESAWTDLGSALGGVNGDPSLVGVGGLTAGSVNQVHLSDAAPGATTALFLGLSELSAPFKGGTLVPDPLVTAFTTTDGLGEFALQFTMSPGVPAGSELYVQFGIVDGAAPAGVALSNAIVGTAP